MTFSLRKNRKVPNLNEKFCIKDRIQVSTRKKRPPTNRKAATDVNTSEMDSQVTTIITTTQEKVINEDPLLSSDPFAFDEQIKKTPKEVSLVRSEETKPTVVTDKKPTLSSKECTVEQDKSDDLDIFKPTSKYFQVCTVPMKMSDFTLFIVNFRCLTRIQKTRKISVFTI